MANAESYPHVRTLLACFIAALVVVVLPAPDGADARSMDRVERKIVKKVNRIRAHHGLARLRGNRKLASSADYHCRDMLRANFFAHSSSNGQSMEQRVERYRRSQWIGETLGYVPTRGGRRGQARRIVTMWMRSPGHRASLLSGTFRRIGVGRRKGRLGGRKVIVFTADLASRR